MRRCLQQVGGQLVGWLLALLATAVYLLTMEPSVSFWDCGEFISTNHHLGIGHPPGAPLYQLLAHLFVCCAGSDLLAVAAWSNALSAVAAGLTVAFLFWSLLLLLRKRGEGLAGGGSSFSSDCFSSAFSSGTLDVASPEGACYKGAPDSPRALLAATVGALCYLFCDTAWFSAVESEVYALAMFFASALFWAMLRWSAVADEPQSVRWLLLVALLCGLSLGVHLMCMLVVPALLLIYLFRRWKELRLFRSFVANRRLLRRLLAMAFFFVVGLTPFLLFPLRAAADPPLNEGDPSSWENFEHYVKRDQYEHAPLYPRIWRQRPNDSLYYADWSGNHGARHGKLPSESVADNLQFFASYQLGYMYGRYLMWNFSGRYNDRNGYGSLQNGQFITGIPFLDRMLVGTGQRPPASLHTESRNVYFLLPLLLGLLGLCAMAHDEGRRFWVVMLLFLFAGPLLAVYLNMPAYEPRERDYAFVLSFYAFCLWIGWGAYAVMGWVGRRLSTPRWRQRGTALRRLIGAGTVLLLMGVPALMAAQNWDDHDRSHRYIARDFARNYLNSCDKNALLLTYGDNDTFPLWYAQLVEQCRCDVQVVNLSLLATDWYQQQMDRQLRARGYAGLQLKEGSHLSSYSALMQLLEDCQGTRPVYLSHYAKAQYAHLFEGGCRLVGYVYEVHAAPGDTVNAPEFARKILSDSLYWTPLEGAFVDWTSQKLLDCYWSHLLLLGDHLLAAQDTTTLRAVLDRSMAQLPVEKVDNLELVDHLVRLLVAVDAPQADATAAYLRSTLAEQLDYYHSIPPRLRRFIPQVVLPREALWAQE